MRTAVHSAGTLECVLFDGRASTYDTTFELDDWSAWSEPDFRMHLAEIVRGDDKDAIADALRVRPVHPLQGQAHGMGLMRSAGQSHAMTAQSGRGVVTESTHKCVGNHCLFR